MEIEIIGNCKIIRGPVPLSSMGALLGNTRKREVADGQLAKRLGATFVIGLPDDLKNLYSLPVCKAIEEEAEIARKAGLSNCAVEWVRHGERGISSETMFSVMTGVSLISRRDYWIPRDVDDFRRCRLLLEAVPELKEKMLMMAQASPAWGRLVEKWREICKLMDEEVPLWRECKGVASRTSGMIDAIVFDGD